MAEVYRLLGADAIYTSAQAKAWLAPEGGRLSEEFQLVDDAPASKIFELNGRKIGVIFFRNLPGAPRPQPHPPAQTSGRSGNTITGGARTPLAVPIAKNAPEDYDPYIQEALEHGRRLASQVDMLIGVSPWGHRDEQRFLERAAGLYHVLLGGGSGVSFPYAPTAAGYPLIWSRPYPEGRSVNLIKLYEWPQPGFQHWTPEISFSAEFQDLGPSIPSAPEIAGLLPQ